MIRPQKSRVVIESLLVPFLGPAAKTLGLGCADVKVDGRGFRRWSCLLDMPVPIQYQSSW